MTGTEPGTGTAPATGNATEPGSTTTTASTTASTSTAALPLARLRDVCLDANDPAVVGAFWGALLGREVQLEADGAFLRPALDGGPGIWVNCVPEPRTAKDRVHLDVDLEPGREVGDLLALGATVVTAPGDEPWWVLADPEGHEFCAFLPQADATNDADAEVPAPV